MNVPTHVTTTTTTLPTCIYCEGACTRRSRLSGCQCFAHCKCLALRLNSYNQFRCPACHAKIRLKDITEAMVRYPELFIYRRYRYLRNRVLYGFYAGESSDFSSGDLTD